MENKGVESFKRLSKLQEQSAESGADFILPDYLGDVRKILYTETVIGPSGKGRADGGEEYYGTLNHNIMYLDSDGKPCGTSFTSDYELFARCPDGEGEIFGDVRITSSSIRLIGPRKFSAKATLTVAPYSLTEEVLSVDGDAFSGENEPESLTRVMNFAQMMDTEPVEREYAECLERLEGRIADEVQVLYSGADICVNEVQFTDGGASLSGTLNVYAVIVDSDAQTYLAEKSIPVEERISVDAIGENMELIPICSVASLVTRINADDTGCEVVCSVVAEYAISADYNGNVPVVTDAYLKEADTENKYSDLRCTSFVEKIKINESGVCTLPKETVCQDPIRDVMIISIQPRLEDTVCEGCDLVLRGELKFTGIASVVTEEGNVSYSPLKFISPFELCLRAENPFSESSVPDVFIEGPMPSAVLDEDSLVVNYKLHGWVRVMENKSLRRLSSCNIVEGFAKPRQKGRITVYYPEPQDTLFSVAKKYHTSVSKVAWDNSLTASVSAGDGEDSLSGVKSILIF